VELAAFISEFVHSLFELVKFRRRWRSIAGRFANDSKSLRDIESRWRSTLRWPPRSPDANASRLKSIDARQLRVNFQHARRIGDV
jgi:hypothetical protein